MTYKELLPFLQNKTKIIVTGPQRSGTGIASFIISRDLNYKFYNEFTLGLTKTDINGIWNNFQTITQKETNFCIHCPGLMHKINEIDDNIAIVVLIRNINDIIKSQNECNWVYEREERVKYFPFSKQINCQQPIAKIKYDFLDYFGNNDNIFRLEYNSLSGHPLWINSKNRTMAIRAHRDKPSDEVPIDV